MFHSCTDFSTNFQWCHTFGTGEEPPSTTIYTRSRWEWLYLVVVNGVPSAINSSCSQLFVSWLHFPISGGEIGLGLRAEWMTLVLLVVNVLQLLWLHAFASFAMLLTTWQSWCHCDIMMTSLWHHHDLGLSLFQGLGWPQAVHTNSTAQKGIPSRSHQQLLCRGKSHIDVISSHFSQSCPFRFSPLAPHPSILSPPPHLLSSPHPTLDLHSPTLSSFHSPLFSAHSPHPSIALPHSPSSHIYLV